MSTFRLSAFLLCNKFLLQDLEVRRKSLNFAIEVYLIVKQYIKNKR